ncbi:hypothetical protein BGZ73_001312 [Actinomortierella ambigua]|nr:hypothetical protein BGZ73_001312 [Actinomortierella ambigua]
MPATATANGNSGDHGTSTTGGATEASASGGGGGLLGFDMAHATTTSMTIPTSEYIAMQNKITEQAVEMAKQIREVRNLKKNVSNLKERVMATSTIKKRLDEYNANLAQVTREKDQAVQEKTLAVHERTQAIQERTQALQEKAHLKAEHAQLVQKHQQLSARVAEIDSVKQELALARREISKANSKANAKQQEVTETKGLLMKTRAEQDNLKRTLTTQLGEIERLKHELNTATTAAAAATAQVDQAQQQQQQQQQVDQSQYEARIEELQSQLDDHSTEYEIERSAWEAKAELALKNEKVAQQEVTKIKAENEQLQREMALAKTETHRLRLDMTRQKAEMERIQKELAEARKTATAATVAPVAPRPVSAPVLADTSVVARRPVVGDVVSQIQDTLAMFAEAGEKLKLLNVLGTAGCLGQSQGNGDSAAVITNLQNRVAELEKQKAALQEHIATTLVSSASRPQTTRRRRASTSKAATTTDLTQEDPLMDSEPWAEQPDLPSTTEATTPATSVYASTPAPATVVGPAKPVRGTRSTASAAATTTAATAAASTTTTTTRKRKAKEPEVDLASMPIRNISETLQDRASRSATATATPTPAVLDASSTRIASAGSNNSRQINNNSNGATPIDSITGTPSSTPMCSTEAALVSPVDPRAPKRPRTIATGPVAVTRVAAGVAKGSSSSLPSPTLSRNHKPMDAVSKLVALLEQSPSEPAQHVQGRANDQARRHKMVKEAVKWTGGKPDGLTRAMLKRAKAIRPLVTQFRQQQQQQVSEPLLDSNDPEQQLKQLLTEEEQVMVELLVDGLASKRARLFEQVMVGLSKSLIHEMEGATVTRLEGTTVVARLVTAVCRRMGALSRMRTMVYDILREYPPSASKVAVTLCEHVAAVWPMVFRLEDVQEGDDGGAQVMLQTFQAVVKQAYEKHASDIRFFGYSTFVEKCEWPKLEEVPSCKDLADYLMEVASTSVFHSRYAQGNHQPQQQALSADFAFQLGKSLEVLLTQAYNAAEIQQWFSTTADKPEDAEGKDGATPPPPRPSLFRMMLEEERYPLAIPLVTRVIGDRRFRKPKTTTAANTTEATTNVPALCDLLGMILQSTATLPHQITAAMGLLELLSSSSSSPSTSSSTSTSSPSGGSGGMSGNKERLQQLKDWYMGLESPERKAVPDMLRWVLARVQSKETPKERPVEEGGQAEMEEVATVKEAVVATVAATEDANEKAVEAPLVGGTEEVTELAVGTTDVSTASELAQPLTTQA